MISNAGPVLDHVTSLVFAGWRSRILHAGAALAIFDHVTAEVPISSNQVAQEIKADPSLLYRLLRALASIGVLAEHDGHMFTLTEAGAYFRADHPLSRRPTLLMREHPVQNRAWLSLAAMVCDGCQDGMLREYGMRHFDYTQQDPAYTAIFNAAMTAQSVAETKGVLEAMASIDLSDTRMMCDIGGGHGALLSGILQAYRHLHGTVFDLASVVEETGLVDKAGLTGRCRFVAGDMFAEVPPGECYLMKQILHDWDDDDCVRILRRCREAVDGEGRLLVCEVVVPGPGTSHSSKLLDIQMLVAMSGRQRTVPEFADIFHRAGWTLVGTHVSPASVMTVLEGVTRGQVPA